MLAMGLAEILVKQDSMTDGQTSVHSVNKQENQPGYVPCPDYQHSDGKQQDECNAYTSDIPCKALCLPARTEIEESEDQDAQQ